jgi:hypothetical protein
MCMIPQESERLARGNFYSLTAVIDTCVFPHLAWLNPIRRAARVGYLVPVWSPLIIAEVTRLHTWRWLRRHSGDQTGSAWGRCSADAKIWFSLMTSVFRVAEDAPPHEAAWDSPRDQWDLPIWNAAKRCGANFVVTENLRDGPPEDDQGRRIFEGVLWCHPDIFLKLLEVWSELIPDGGQDLLSGSSRAQPSARTATEAAPVSDVELPKSFLDFLDDLYARASGDSVESEAADDSG